MAIKAIIFDLDDTLIEQRPANRAAYRAVCKIVHRRCGISVDTLYGSIVKHGEAVYRAGPLYEYCHAVGIGRTECLWGDIAHDNPEVRKLAEWVPGFRRETWTGFLAEYGVNDAAFAEDIQNRFIEERQLRQVVFPDVEPALRELQKQYRLALLTNGAPSLQRFKIKAPGLSPYLANVTISGDLGFGKPDPRIFQHIIDLLGVPPEAAVMIGDNLKRDIQGAQNAGLRGIWINRFNDHKPNTLGSDEIIDNLWQLTAMFK